VTDARDRMADDVDRQQRSRAHKLEPKSSTVAAGRRCGDSTTVDLQMVLPGSLPPSRSTRSELAICCVSDGKTKYRTQAVRWARSARWFLGEDVDLFVGLTEECPPAYHREFTRLGVTTLRVPSASDWHGPSNKIGVLQAPQLKDHQTVVLTDCDVVFLADVSAKLVTNRLKAKPADAATVGNDALSSLFVAAGLPVPLRKVRTSICETELLPYCNSGVVVLPRRLRDTFVDRWLYWNRFLLQNNDLLGSRSFFTDQASFALALSEHIEDYEELPVEFNFPGHLDITRYPPHLREARPAILHYHDRVDGRSGGLLEIGLPGVDAAVRAFNQRLREDRRNRNFTNELFWDERYSVAPALGSGIGSRGLHADYKAELVSDLVAAHPHADAIADFGCGDCSLLDRFFPPGYIGVDSSIEVIESNRIRFPATRFIHADMATASVQCDLSLCLDVLIHQPTCEEFDAVLKQIIANSRVGGLVNGFEYDPGFASDIVFFHRPLGGALEALGVTAVPVGQYRETIVYQWNHPSDPFAPP
jgi:hypothetical protein